MFLEIKDSTDMSAVMKDNVHRSRTDKRAKDVTFGEYWG